MPKKTDERLEELKLIHETLEMMIQLIKDLGFEPPPQISQHEGANREKTAAVYGDELNNIYQAYVAMHEDKERLKIKLDTLMTQNAEILCASREKSSVKEELGPQQKKASNRRAKRKSNPWGRPKRRRRQPNVK
ncbi:hypothetical protein GGI42DRAFT_219264 [Trichoderma sp. SZMC 28013]